MYLELIPGVNPATNQHRTVIHVAVSLGSDPRENMEFECGVFLDCEC